MGFNYEFLKRILVYHKKTLVLIRKKNGGHGPPFLVLKSTNLLYVGVDLLNSILCYFSLNKAIFSLLIIYKNCRFYV